MHFCTFNNYTSLHFRQDDKDETEGGHKSSWNPVGATLFYKIWVQNGDRRESLGESLICHSVANE